MSQIAYYRNLVILAGIGPLLMLGWDAWNGQLGANSVNNALHITGILSLVFLFLSLIITPLRVLSGWNSLIAYRRALGLYGFFYATLHFVIYVALDRMGSLSSTIEEIASRRFLLVGFVAFTLMLPLAVTSTNAMLRKLGAGRWKLLHRLAYVAAILGVLHYYMLVKSDIRQPLAFALVLAPILGFRSVKHYWDLRRQAMGASAADAIRPSQDRRFWTGELVVENIHRETHDVKTFRFIHPTGEIPFVHHPGQYMTITVSVDGQSMKRSYTIASAPTQRGHVELTVKRNPHGLVSRFMHDNIKVGDRIRIGAPGGRFYFDHWQSNAVVLIAGGVGITPLMSILRCLTDRSWHGTIYFINAIRSNRDQIYQAELAQLANRFDNLHVLTFCSQSKLEPTSQLEWMRWRETTCRVNAPDLSAFVAQWQETPVFLCGPDSMMESVRQMVMELGVSEGQLYTEEFVSPRGEQVASDSSQVDSSGQSSLLAASAAINFQSAGRSTEIDSPTTILEAAEQVGVKIAWECRSGVCGQCKVRCVSGRVAMESREALSVTEEQAGFILACQSRPVTDSVSIDA